MSENNNAEAVNTDLKDSPVQSAPPAGEKTYTFRNTYLGAGLMGAALLAVIIAGLFTPHFFDGSSILSILFNSVPLFAVAFATALTSRAKGPDMSVGAMIAISSIIITLVTNGTGSWVVGLLAAVGVCAVLGALNGALIVFLKIPSVILTLVTPMAFFGLLYALLATGNINQGQFIFSQISGTDMLNYGAYLFIPATFIIAFVIIWLTKLGAPIHKRDKKAEPIYILAYVGSAAIGAVVGLLAVAEQGIPTMSSFGYEYFILFVYAAVMSTRVADNKFFPAVYALAPALVWSLLSNIMATVSGDIFYYQPVITYGLILVFLVVAYISKYEKKQKLL